MFKYTIKVLIRMDSSLSLNYLQRIIARQRAKLKIKKAKSACIQNTTASIVASVVLGKMIGMEILTVLKITRREKI